MFSVKAVMFSLTPTTGVLWERLLVTESILLGYSHVVRLIAIREAVISIIIVQF